MITTILAIIGAAIISTVIVYIVTAIILIIDGKLR
jgi:hypothetical protein